MYIYTIASQCSPKTIKSEEGIYSQTLGVPLLHQCGGGACLNPGAGTIGHTTSPGYHATVTSPTQEQANALQLLHG